MDKIQKQILAHRVVEDLLANLHDREHQELLYQLAEQGVFSNWDDQQILDYFGAENIAELSI